MHSLDAIKKQNNTTAAEDAERLATRVVWNQDGTVWLKHNGVTRTFDHKVDVDAFTNSIRGKNKDELHAIIRSHFTKHPAH
jgi:hypothetical protein